MRSALSQALPCLDMSSGMRKDAPEFVPGKESHPTGAEKAKVPGAKTIEDSRLSGAEKAKVPGAKTIQDVRLSGDEKEKSGGAEKEKSGSARPIDLEKEDGGADATQAKSGGAVPSSRLKNPPKAAAETSSTKAAAAAREASTAGAPKGHTSKDKGAQDKGLPDEALTQAAQHKYEAQEEKLKDVARHAMSSLRDFHKLSESEYAKKVIEIRKALMKYEMQYVRVWELQDRTRRSEIDESQSKADRLHGEAGEENAKSLQLSGQLDKEKQRKRRYEAHEAAASVVNQKRSRVELQADIDAKTAEIEQLRRQKGELKEQAEHIQQRGQLLREAAADMKQLLASQMESPSGVSPTGGVRKTGPAPLVSAEVMMIS